MPMTIEELLRELRKKEFGKMSPEEVRRLDVGKESPTEERSEIGEGVKPNQSLSQLMSLINPIGGGRGFAARAPLSSFDLSGFILPDDKSYYANLKAGIPMNIGGYRFTPGASVEFAKGKGYDESGLSAIEAMLMTPNRNMFRVSKDVSSPATSIGYTRPLQNGAYGVNYIVDPMKQKQLQFFLQQLF